MSIRDLYKGHPFSKFSAEEEVEYLDEIYFRANYYDEIYDNLKTSSSRFIIGKRGIGKSALLLNLKNKLEEEFILTVVIDDYRTIPLKKNINSLLDLILQKIITHICLSLLKNKRPLKSLDKIEKEKLVFIIINFYKSLSSTEFSKQINNVIPLKLEGYFKILVNKFIVPPANLILNTGISVVRDTLFQHLDLKTSTPVTYKNYFPELDIKNFNEPIDKKILLKDNDKLINILKDLSCIIKKLGYKNTVILLDKIDEKKDLGGTIDKIVEFTEDILLDTSFLQINNISFGFSLWSEVKNRLNVKGVRFDKFPPIDITWSQDDLKKILLKRINYFLNRNITTLSEIFESKENISHILKLSNNSPRDMIILMSRIHACSSQNNTLNNKYDTSIVKEGSKIFVKEYDYRSVYPSSTSSRTDIISYITKLLNLAKTTFGSSDLVLSLKISQSAANNQIKQLNDYGIIKEHHIKKINEKQYTIIDPKIIFAIENSIKIG